MGTQYGPKVVTDGLIFYLDAKNPLTIEEFQWIDIINKTEGYRLDSTYNSNGWFEFDAASTNYIPYTAPIANFGNSNFSIEILIRISDIGSDAGIVTKHYIDAWSVIYVSASNLIGLFIDGYYCSVQMDNYYDDWVYLSWTVDNSNNIQKSYANGIFDNETNNAVGNVTSANSLDIGRLSYNSSGYLTGDVATVKLYNKILTPNEIYQNYNAIKGRFI